MSRKDIVSDDDIKVVDIDLRDIEDKILDDLDATMNEVEGADLPEIENILDNAFIDDIVAEDEPLMEMAGPKPVEAENTKKTESGDKTNDSEGFSDLKEALDSVSTVDGPTSVINKTKKKQKKSPIDIIRGFVMLIAVCVLVYAGYQLTTIYMEYKEAVDEYDEMDEFVSTDNVDYKANYDLGEPFDPNFVPAQIDWSGLVSVNSEIYAWIQFEGSDLDISYPVAKGIDNEYYLKHTVNGTANTSGSIYIDCENDPYFNDTNTFIYGHNMKNGSMFGKLKNYKKAEFYAGHEYFWIYTPDTRARYKIFSCYEPAASSDAYRWWPDFCDEYTAYLENAKAISIYDTGVDVSGSDQIITLSTCTSRGDDYRFIVQAKLVYKEYK